MGYHAINEGGQIPVYCWSSCAAESKKGTLYNAEVFTALGYHSGYLNVMQIKYLNSNGTYDSGFIDSGQYGNLVYSGTKIYSSTLGKNMYRFKLNKSLKIVSPSGSIQTTLASGSYIYSVGATCGQSTPQNMAVVGYVPAGRTFITFYEGFVTLDYTYGSMFNKKFCISAD